MRKKLLGASAVMLIAALAGCGGGGGGGNNNTSSSSATDVITTQVVASYVKGAKVCVEGTNKCAITNSVGVAAIPGVVPPVKLEISLGEVPLGDVQVENSTEVITPADIAGGDKTVAQLIEDIIHSLGKENGETVDVSHLKAKVEKPLVELVKEAIKEEKPVEIPLGEHHVEIDPHEKEVIVDDKPVPHHPLPKPEHTNEKALEILHHLAKFLAKANGKCVAFYDEEEHGATCKLLVNPANPLQFKLTQCENPHDNDDTYEDVFIKDGKVYVIDEDGTTAEVVKVEDDKLYYKAKASEGNGTIEGYMALAQTCHKPGSGYGYGYGYGHENGSGYGYGYGYGHENGSGYGYGYGYGHENGSGYGYGVPAPSRHFFPDNISQVWQFFEENEHKTVKTSDGGSCFISEARDENGEYIVEFTDCQNTAARDGQRKLWVDSDHKVLVKLPNGKVKVYVYADDETVCTDEFCLYTNPEPSQSELTSLMKVWIGYKVDTEKKELIPEYCAEFKDGALYATDCETGQSGKLADYSVSGNTIVYTNQTDPEAPKSHRVFKVAGTDIGTFVFTYTIWPDDEGIEFFKVSDSCQCK